MKFLGVTILQGVEFPIFLLIFAWALQQCSATALSVILTYLLSCNVSKLLLIICQILVRDRGSLYFNALADGDSLQMRP